MILPPQCAHGNRNGNGAGGAALIYAASAGKVAIVAQLPAADADVTPESLDGFTAPGMTSTIECLTTLRKANRTPIALEQASLCPRQGTSFACRSTPINA